MRCSQCGHVMLFGVIGRADGCQDVWAMNTDGRWSSTTLQRAQREADERNEFATRGVAVFMGRVWMAVALDENGEKHDRT
jgi:hypothetical protein